MRISDWSSDVCSSDLPAMIYMLVDMVKAQAVDLSKLRTILYGGSPIAPERLAECLEVIGPVFVQSYGMTEAVGGDTHLSNADPLLGGARLSPAGQPSLHPELRILADDALTRAHGKAAGARLVGPPGTAGA